MVDRLCSVVDRTVDFDPSERYEHCAGLYGVFRRAELPERPEWSAAGTTDIFLPAVHFPDLFTYAGEGRQCALSDARGRAAVPLGKPDRRRKTGLESELTGCQKTFYCQDCYFKQCEYSTVALGTSQ